MDKNITVKNLITEQSLVNNEVKKNGRNMQKEFQSCVWFHKTIFLAA
jgi:hypothetical protein